MKANFRNAQNLALFAVVLLTIPAGAAAGWFLLKKKGSIRPFVSLESKPEKVVKTATVDPMAIEERVIQEKVLDPMVMKVLDPDTIIGELDPAQVQRLLGRFEMAFEESRIHQHIDELREAVRKADVVERVHTVTFNMKNLRLDQRDKLYLISAMQNNRAMRTHKTNPEAKLLILGYASIDGDRKNNHYALSRARGVEKAIGELRKTLSFTGITKSWCVGETDLLSKESGTTWSQSNRAAEIWLVVSDHPALSHIESDNFSY